MLLDPLSGKGGVVMPFSVIASDRRERGNLVFSVGYEIASVASLPRNDIMTQPF